MNTSSTTVHPEIARLAMEIKLASTDQKKKKLLAELHSLSQRLETLAQTAIAEARHKQILAELKISQIKAEQAVHQAYSDGCSAGRFDAKLLNT